jgi:hypothetical protein
MPRSQYRQLVVMESLLVQLASSSSQALQADQRHQGKGRCPLTKTVVVVVKPDLDLTGVWLDSLEV